MYCHECGQKLPEGAVYCPECGTKVVLTESPEESTKWEDHLPSEHPQERIRQASFSVGELGDDFIKYVNHYVQSSTGFSSVSELLRSKVPVTFYWQCFLIPTLVIWGVTWLAVLIYSGEFMRGFLVATLIAILLGPIIGFFAAYVMGWNERRKVSNRYSNVFFDSIDIDHLARFLSESLPLVSPIFQQWGKMTQVGYSVSGVISAQVANSLERAANEVTIGTELSPKNKFFAELAIGPDLLDRASGRLRYTPWLEHRIVGVFSIKKYTLLVQIAPILQAAMEYYLEWVRQQNSAQK